jgi:hypothetical protein
VKPIINDKIGIWTRKKSRKTRSSAMSMRDKKLYKEIVSGRPKALKRDEVSKKRG